MSSTVDILTSPCYSTLDMSKYKAGPNVIVAGLPPLSEGMAHALGPWQWIKDSTLWIFVYLMMEFILKDPALKNSV